MGAPWDFEAMMKLELSFFKPPLTFDQYCMVASNIRPQLKHWRRGQTHFNVLREVRPDLAEKIRGEAQDPFHRTEDQGLADFYEWLDKNWES